MLNHVAKFTQCEKWQKKCLKIRQVFKVKNRTIIIEIPEFPNKNSPW